MTDQTLESDDPRCVLRAFINGDDQGGWPTADADAFCEAVRLEASDGYGCTPDELGPITIEDVRQCKPAGCGEPFAPRATGRSTEADLAGKVFPWSNGEPVLLAMPMSEWRYLPIFDSPEALAATMGKAGVSYVSVKRIDDAAEFLLASIVPADVRVIVDLRFTETGTCRFLQIDLGVSHG